MWLTDEFQVNSNKSNGSSNLDILKFGDGQVYGGWLGSMATAGPGIPDILDG